MINPALNLEESLFGANTNRAIATPALIQAMIDSGDGISDLIFSPGRPPQVERHGNLVGVEISAMPVLRPEDTAAIARDLIDGKEHVLRTLHEEGACEGRDRAHRADHQGEGLARARVVPRARIPRAVRPSSCAGTGEGQRLDDRGGRERRGGR